MQGLGPTASSEEEDDDDGQAEEEGGESEEEDPTDLEEQGEANPKSSSGGTGLQEGKME